MDKNKFTIIDESGEEKSYDVLFTFDSDETGKSYMVYTDNSIDEEGNTRVYASIYNPNEDEVKLEPIETDREWTIIEKILEEIQASAQSGETNEQ